MKPAPTPPSHRLVEPPAAAPADRAFISADRGPDFRPKIVVTGFLPAHPAALGDVLNVSVSLRRSDHSGRARDRGIWIALGDRFVYPGPDRGRVCEAGNLMIYCEPRGLQSNFVAARPQ